MLDVEFSVSFLFWPYFPLFGLVNIAEGDACSPIVNLLSILILYQELQINSPESLHFFLKLRNFQIPCIEVAAIR
jgi:hypothetical protein